MDRRCRRRIRSKMKQKLRRKCMQGVKYNLTDYYQQIRRNVHSFSDVFNACMPNHFKYLITAKQSPFLQKKLEKVNFTHELRLTVPNEFSILRNPSASYGFLKKLISIILYQSCKHLQLDYSNCKICDLATQVFLDSILIDNHEFIKQCQRANLTKYLKIESIGGYGINEKKLQLMINSVGSPVELLNRKIKFSNIIPFKLRHIDGSCVTKRIQSGQKEIDTTDLIQYVIDCLGRFDMNLSQRARQDFYNCSSLTNVTFEEGTQLKSITNDYLDDGAVFNNCAALSIFEIPVSVELITNEIFYNYKNHLSIYCMATNPPVIDHLSCHFTLYVPALSFEAYKNSHRRYYYSSIKPI